MEYKRTSLYEEGPLKQETLEASENAFALKAVLGIVDDALQTVTMCVLFCEGEVETACSAYWCGDRFEADGTNKDQYRGFLDAVAERLRDEFGIILPPQRDDVMPQPPMAEEMAEEMAENVEQSNEDNDE